MLQVAPRDGSEKGCTKPSQEKPKEDIMKRDDVNKTSYRKEYWEYTGVDDREMGGDPMRQGELAHVRDIPHEIVCTVTEYGGEHCEEGEEEGGPVVDVGEEEVVDMDTTLGSKRYSHQEDNHKHN